MDINAIVEAVFKLGLIPTLLILFVYWNKETNEKRIRYLERQNERLLDIVERMMFKEEKGDIKDEH